MGTIEMQKVHFTAKELADRWSMSPLTLKNWRTQGRGPKFFKPGKQVLYRIDVVETWEKNREQRNTVEHFG